jgi:hypothetical protein
LDLQVWYQETTSSILSSHALRPHTPWCCMHEVGTVLVTWRLMTTFLWVALTQCEGIAMES